MRSAQRPFCDRQRALVEAVSLAFARRVTGAWETLKTEERRAAYDKARTRAPAQVWLANANRLRAAAAKASKNRRQHGEGEHAGQSPARSRLTAEGWLRRAVRLMTWRRP